MSVPRETLTGTLGVSRETRERLDAFADCLRRWNGKINLVSRADEQHLWSRHMADSLQLGALIMSTARSAIDLGSGGGFPGLVLAIATGLPFTLIEADSRKATFLREAARVTGTTVTVLTQRIEDANPPAAELITARALAPLAKLLAYSQPLLTPGGTMLFLKGKRAEAEIAEARLDWTMRIERHESQTGGGGVILRISEVQRA